MSAPLQLPTNDRVSWAGTRYGLLPVLADPTCSLEQVGQESLPDLLGALADPERFVVAHILLTRISGVRYETFPTWNGLEVRLEPDGAARVDADQRSVLAARWQHWSSSEPRPGTLPDTD
jgi:hypothetical protein